MLVKPRVGVGKTLNKGAKKPRIGLMGIIIVSKDELEEGLGVVGGRGDRGKQ